jgi:NADPH2:quinone reductase
MIVNRVYRLRRRPAGRPADGDLELVHEPVPDLVADQALVRMLFLSVDPTTRIWMGGRRGFMPPVPIGGLMRGLGVGEVAASRRDDMKEGDLVAGFTGLQEFCLADDELLDEPLAVLPPGLAVPPSAFIGVLGHTGVIAYLGIDYLRPRAGQTLVVSAAAGAVGSIAGQLGKLAGARVVGIAGGPEKCSHVVTDFGFDACVDHTDPQWRQHLDAATPDGIDMDFESIGGVVMDHILMRLNVHAKVFLCGEISHYNEPDQRASLINIDQIHMQRATMQGGLVTDHMDRWPEAIGHLAGLLADGKLKHEETVVDGIESVPEALDRVFSRSTVGKLVIRVAEPSVAARCPVPRCPVPRAPVPRAPVPEISPYKMKMLPTDSHDHEDLFFDVSFLYLYDELFTPGIKSSRS